MPEFQQLRPGDEDALVKFLVDRGASSIFLQSAFEREGLAASGQAPTLFYGAFRGTDLLGVVGQGARGTLWIQAPEHAAELARTLVAYSGRSPPSIAGPYAQVQLARKALGRDTHTARIDACETLYELELDELVVPTSLLDGKVERIHPTQRHLDVLIRWANDYAVEVLGLAQTHAHLAATREKIQRAITNNEIWMLLERGVPVARSSFSARTSNAVQVSAMYTPPEMRRRGFARSIVAASLADMHEKGIRLTALFMDPSNRAGQACVRSLGFKPTAYFGVLIFDRA